MTGPLTFEARKKRLLRLRERVEAMNREDPAFQRWQWRFIRAAHRLVELELRHAVAEGTRPVVELDGFLARSKATLAIERALTRQKKANAQCAEFDKMTREFDG